MIAIHDVQSSHLTLTDITALCSQVGVHGYNVQYDFIYLSAGIYLTCSVLAMTIYHPCH